MGLGFVWLWAFLSSAHSFAPFCSLTFPVVPFCYFYYDVIWPKPAGPLWVYCLFFSQWLSMAIGLFITLLASSCVPFISSWASLAHLLSLGFLRLFPNSTLPWSFTNSFRPLLSLFALLRVCCGSFSLFYIIYYPWVYYFSLSRLLQAHLFIS